MKNKNSLRTKIWIYLIIFSGSILIFLWIFQILFLNSYYKLYKSKELESVIDNVIKVYKVSDYETQLDDLSRNHEICIEIVNNDKTKYLSVIYNKGCIGSENIKDSLSYKQDFIKSDQIKKNYTIINPRYKNETLIYGIKLDDSNYAFISASLVPLDTTITVLKNQFIYVTILVIMLSLVVSYFISKKISNPIIKMNKEAKKLAKGDFEASFETNVSILEINELSETLEYTKNELSKTEELRRELMSNVSHDLKTPLTMIKAYAEMIRDVTYKSKDKRNQNLNVIIEETDRLNILVNDILELSSIQSGTQKLNLEEFNINELITTIAKRYDIYEQQDKYKFELNLLKNDTKVFADKKRIEQVMYNLINNAINYTGKDKKIVINLIDMTDSIKIEVKDTGSGIDEKELKNIWDKYYKIDKTHSRSNNGSGIGLSIVKNILINHSFEYGVTSKKGKGTTFYFEIKKTKINK